MTFLEEIIELYFKVGKYFGKFNAYLKQRNDKQSFIVKDWHILLFSFFSQRCILDPVKHEILLRKWLPTLSRQISLQKAPSQVPMFVATEFLHGFHKTISGTTRSVKI